MLNFQPLYFEDEIGVINPFGDVAMITLWTSLKEVKSKLLEMSIDLDPSTSRFVAITNFYGNGMNHFLRNLMHNPQIKVLIICGKDRSNSGKDLINFFKEGTSPHVIGKNNLYKINNSERVIDISRSFFTRNISKEDLRVYKLGESLKEEELLHILKQTSIINYPIKNRVTSPIRELDFTRKPENPYNHTVYYKDIIESWKELIYRCFNFGIDKGGKRELTNTVVMLKTIDYLDKDNFYSSLEENGIFKNNIMTYVDSFSKGEIDTSVAYTYGNRLREYFGFDILFHCASLIYQDDAGAYFSLWDNKKDLNSKERPCFASGCFNRKGDTLDFTVTFRSHNLLNAWILNVIAICCLYKAMLEVTDLKEGVLTVISHRLSLDMDRAYLVEDILTKRKNETNLDPNGEFRVKIINNAIIVQHIFQGIVIKEYSGTTSQKLQHEIYREKIITDINHAMYLGRQLERAENCLRNNTIFIQD